MDDAPSTSFEGKDIDDYAVLIGNREWMNQNGMPVPKQIDQLMMRQEERGQTAVLVAIDGTCCCVIVFVAVVFDVFVKRNLENLVDIRASGIYFGLKQIFLFFVYLLLMSEK